MKLVILVYAIIASLALMLVKKGSLAGLYTFSDHRFQLHLTFTFLSGIFLYGISFLIYIFLLTRFNLGYIIPMTTAFVYVVVFVASYIFLRESYSLIKIAGIALIIIGVLLINLKS